MQCCGRLSARAAQFQLQAVQRKQASRPPWPTRFRELLAGSEEGIASNILADRLQHLVALGVLTRAADPSHKQKQIYSLTEMGIQLLPVFVASGKAHQPAQLFRTIGQRNKPLRGDVEF